MRQRKPSILRPAAQFPLAGLSRRRFLQYGAMATGTGIITACTGSAPEPGSPPAATTTDELTKVTFGTNWYAQAEHGGFYQAVATGIYAEHGLDVTIQMGGPQVNGTQLLMGGAIDFFMGYGSDALKAIQEGIPKVTVAAMFQKDPQILVAHPGTAETLEDLQGRPVYVSAAANVTYWPLLVANYGYTEEMNRPNNYNDVPI